MNQDTAKQRVNNSLQRQVTRLNQRYHQTSTMPPSAKRPRLKFESYQDFLGGDEDYSVLHHTEARFNSRSGLIPRGSSPQKLETDWTIEDSWYPDDPEFALDDEAGELYDKEIDQEGWKVERDGQKNKRKRKREKNPRSQTSVRLLLVLASSTLLT